MPPRKPTTRKKPAVRKKPAAPRKPVVRKKPVANRNKNNGELPLSGSEHEFKHAPWVKVIMSNNCYAYAFHDLRKWRPHKSVPGVRSTGVLNSDYTHCKGIARKIVEDNPGKVRVVRYDKKCPKGYYKVMMVVAPKDRNGNHGGDFHFYKQHGVVNYTVREGDTMDQMVRFFKVPKARLIEAANRVGGFGPGKTMRFVCNCFSHKMGWATGPLLVDSKGLLIKDPRKAGRRYGLDYSKYCNSFCVANKGIKVGSRLADILGNTV